MKMRVGNKLLEAREQRKLNQVDMAELLGVSQAVYSRLERNEGSIDLEQVVRFSQKLNIPIQDFLPETITMKSHNEHGQVAFMVGNFYNGVDKDKENLIRDYESKLVLKNQENTFLKEKISLLEGKIKDLEEKIELMRKL